MGFVNLKSVQLLGLHTLRSYPVFAQVISELEVYLYLYRNLLY
jgi:hypothetical protein